MPRSICRGGTGGSFSIRRMSWSWSSAPERRAERQHLVERRPQGVDVAPGVRDAAEPLGGHEAQRPDQVVRLREVVPILELGQAEVGDPDVPQRVEDQVRRLDVAVQHAPLVGIGQGVGDLGAQPGDLAIVARLALADEGAGRAGERR